MTLEAHTNAKLPAKKRVSLYQTVSVFFTDVRTVTT